MNILSEIQSWYQSQCNGDWEHGYGIKIETLDNPGWHVSINLEQTNLEDKYFKKIEKDYSDDDWFICRVLDKNFDGNGDSKKLEVILQIFLDWSKT